MAKRLYVGNLPYTMASEDLQSLFEVYGKVVSASVLSDRETGRSRGFGFVEMEIDGEALAAIEKLDGQDHQGRRLTVNEARARQAGGGGDRPERGGYGGGGGYGGVGGGYGGGGDRSERGGYGGGGGDRPERGSYGGGGGSGGYGADRGERSDRGGFGGGRDRDRDRDRGRNRDDY